MMNSAGVTLIVIFALLLIGLIFRYFQLEKRKRNQPRLQIVKIVIVKEPNKYFNNNNDICCICLDSMEIDKKKTLSSMECEHTFHTECLLEWLKIKGICPICRVD